MAVDKRISVEPKNEVGIGSIKRKVEVIPFKPKPDSPFATPEGIFDLPKPKPEDKPEDKKMVSADDFEFYFRMSTGKPGGYKLSFLKTLTLDELDELLQETLRTPGKYGGLITKYKEGLRKP